MKVKDVFPEAAAIAKPKAEEKDRHEELRQQGEVARSEKPRHGRVSSRPGGKRRHMYANRGVALCKPSIDQRPLQCDREVLSWRHDVREHHEQPGGHDDVEDNVLGWMVRVPPEVQPQPDERGVAGEHRERRGPGDLQAVAVVPRCRRKNEGELRRGQ